MGEVREARPEDAGGIVEALRAGMPARAVPYTIFGGSGIDRFVSEAVGGAPRGLGRFWVWEAGGRVDGFAELRREGERLFLNHVYVHPRAQDRGAGRALLRAALAASAAGAEELELEVFSGNARAIGWYRTLGLQPVGAAGWWLVPWPPDRPRVAGWRAVGLGEAAAAHARYGFSRFALEDGSGRRFTLGRLGARALRTLEPGLVQAPGALAALAALGLAERLLCIAPGPAPSSQATLLIEALRMRGPAVYALARCSPAAGERPVA
ncbi:MAG: GNAT family N-acetyltransferase [Anaeromyxobacter sp.]